MRATTKRTIVNFAFIDLSYGRLEYTLCLSGFGIRKANHVLAIDFALKHDCGAWNNIYDNPSVFEIEVIEIKGRTVTVKRTAIAIDFCSYFNLHNLMCFLSISLWTFYSAIIIPFLLTLSHLQMSSCHVPSLDKQHHVHYQSLNLSMPHYQPHQ